MTTSDAPNDSYEFLAKQHAEMKLKDLRRKVAEWVNSPEAVATFKAVAKAIAAEEAQMEHVRRELYELMRKPVEI